MKKKEVQDLLRKFYMIGGISLGGGLLLTIVFTFIFPSISFIFLMIGIFVVMLLFFIFFCKAKKMESNLCIKCASNEKTEVIKDEFLGNEAIKNISYEVHLVTHKCKNCGTSYICHEYKQL